MAVLARQQCRQGARRGRGRAFGHDPQVVDQDGQRTVVVARVSSLEQCVER
jgi:hypothetical protein